MTHMLTSACTTHLHHDGRDDVSVPDCQVERYTAGRRKGDTAQPRSRHIRPKGSEVLEDEHAGERGNAGAKGVA